MASDTRGWHKIGYHNYRDMDWKKKFMHHEEKTGANLWGWGSQLQREGYLVPKSKYASRGHGNKKNKYDSRWKWNPDKNLSMQNKWAQYGRITGKGRENEGYTTFRLGDINKKNYDNVNWQRQFGLRGWGNLPDGWVDPGSRSDGDSYFDKKKDNWDTYAFWDEQGMAPEPDAPDSDGPNIPDAPGPGDDITIPGGSTPSTVWSPEAGTYTNKGIRKGLFTKRGSRTSGSPTGFFNRRGRRLAGDLKIGGQLNTGQSGSLNI